jgi:hypothetical protein
MMTWNVSAIVNLAGGVANLRRLLARTGQDVPDTAAVSMWKTRNRLPSAWTAPILYALVQRTPDLDLVDLMTDQPGEFDTDPAADPFADREAAS